MQLHQPQTFRKKVSSVLPLRSQRSIQFQRNQSRDQNHRDNDGRVLRLDALLLHARTSQLDVMSRDEAS